MSSAICFNLDQFKVLSSGNGLNTEECKIRYHLVSVYNVIVTFTLHVNNKGTGVKDNDFNSFSTLMKLLPFT